MKFIDLDRQYEIIGFDIQNRINSVISKKTFIMGEEIDELENNLASYVGRKYALTCSSGTDALVISLMTYELRKVDVVFVPSFTFFATAESVVLAGATPAFVDCDESYNIDTGDLERQIEKIRKEGKYCVKGIIAVDLFGQPANYDEINSIAEKYNLFLLEDAAQGFGAEYKGKKAGCFGDISATSFFPAKPLGCYGDGGAIFTDCKELYDKMRSIRIHGMGSNRYDNVRIGLNGRLDNIQAAVLLPKLAILDDELGRRNEIAKLYTERLKEHFITPHIGCGKKSAWAQYSLLVDEEEKRDFIIKGMQELDIPVMVYYPIPLHLQTAFRYLGFKEGDFPKCEKIAKKIFSIPMHPYLREEEVNYITENLIDLC